MTSTNGHALMNGSAGNGREPELVRTPLLPEGYAVPASRWTHPSQRLRQLLDHEPYVFAPGVYDPFTAQLAMYYRFKAAYFSGYSFAMGHVGSTDMDLYAGVEIADAARRTVSALRKFQLTMAVGDPDAGVAPSHLEIPPVVLDMDGGYGNAFNVGRTTELYVGAGVAGAHIEDQVLPKRCGHIAGKALIDAGEMLGKLRMIRDVANDVGNPDFVIVARTDAVSAVDAPEPQRGLPLAIDRALRYLESGLPDLVWCEFPTSERGPVETFAAQVRKRFPEARLAFNWSSSFKWHEDPSPLRFAELGQMGFKFIFITLAAIHANGLGFSRLLQWLAERQEQGYVDLQRTEWTRGADLPSRSHHLFSGVPYHHLVGNQYGAARLGREVAEEHRAELAL
ncbi:MAG: isocitrate lyase/PEP mutase family protein [Chloroflexi bacterium]|nr:isocitrate lyase/PEP mutase family protein [Chloroflexota bacterium]